jgi:hypothetical protein
MRLEDITECYQLGQGLFTSQLATTLYRTWDEYKCVPAK